MLARFDRPKVARGHVAAGHLVSFDRRKCKAPPNGPQATDEHCSEGFAFHKYPGPSRGIRERHRRGELSQLGHLQPTTIRQFGCRDEIVGDARVAPEHARRERMDAKQCAFAGHRVATGTPLRRSLLRSRRRHSPGFSRERRAMERATGLLAGAAGIGADTAVLMHGGKALAFCRTDTASLGTGHQLSLHQHRTRLRKA